MGMIISTRRLAAGVRRRIAHLVRDRRGVAAVEFALLAPLLLTLYFVTQEVAQGIETNKKVGRVASMVADLVTQQQSMSATELEAILKIGSAIMYPYGRSFPAIEVTAIRIPDQQNPTPVVHWSGRSVNNSFGPGATPGTPVDVPEALNMPNSFLVKVTASLEYRPVITWAAEQKASMGLAGAFDRIDMRETYYLRPRMTNQIDCPTCPK